MNTALLKTAKPYERYVKEEPDTKGIKFYQYTETDSGSEYMKIYPNPAQEYIKIELASMSGENVHVEIIDLLGNTVLSKNYVNTPIITIEIPELECGSYVAVCRTGNSIQSTKFVKN